MEDFKHNQFRLKALLKWNQKAWSGCRLKKKRLHRFCIVYRNNDPRNWTVWVQHFDQREIYNRMHYWLLGNPLLLLFCWECLSLCLHWFWSASDLLPWVNCKLNNHYKWPLAWNTHFQVLTNARKTQCVYPEQKTSSCTWRCSHGLQAS